MRLKERTLIEIRIAPRLRKTGALGGAAEAFSEDTLTLRASRLPEGGDFSMDGRGASCPDRLRLIAAADASVRPGDGAWVEGRLYRILTVRRWTAHVEMICEAIA